MWPKILALFMPFYTFLFFSKLELDYPKVLAPPCQDTQHNDTQHNDTQHNDTQHNDTQHNGFVCNTQHYNKLKATLSITTLSISNGSVVMLKVITPSVIMVNVVMLSVVAPVPHQSQSSSNSVPVANVLKLLTAVRYDFSN